MHEEINSSSFSSHGGIVKKRRTEKLWWRIVIKRWRRKNGEINALLLSHEGWTKLKLRKMNSKRCRLSLKEIATWTGSVILLIDKVARRTVHRVTVVLAVRITRGNTKENKFEGLWMRMFIYLVSNVRRRKKTFWVPIRLPDLTPWSLRHRDSLMSHANAIRSMHMRHASCL